MHGTLSGSSGCSTSGSGSMLSPSPPPAPRTAQYQLPFASRASFELREDDLELLGRFRTASTGSLRAIDSLPALAQEDPTYQSWLEEHPCVLTHFEDFVDLLRNKRLAVFLDYDGTLTPIVNIPENAFMSDQMRAAVKAVAQRFPTAIVSGRGRDKVENFVQLPELFYAGSHGMDIAGPRCCSSGTLNEAFTHQPAAEFKPLMDCMFAELTKRLADIPGAYVEHNNFCVSAHFRNCSVDSWQAVVAAVDEAVGCDARLRITRGRKVLEVRPEVDWDKGRALNHLLDALGLNGRPDVVAIYIGDDKTDEDAFKCLRAQNAGVGILVSTKAKPTAAAYTVRDPAQVQALLVRLVSEYGGTEWNGWSQQPGSCNGWAPAPSDTAAASAAEAIAVTEAVAGSADAAGSEPAINGEGAGGGATATQAAAGAATASTANGDAPEFPGFPCSVNGEIGGAAAAPAATAFATASSEGPFAMLAAGGSFLSSPAGVHAAGASASGEAVHSNGAASSRGAAVLPNGSAVGVEGVGQGGHTGEQQIQQQGRELEQQQGSSTAGKG